MPASISPNAYIVGAAEVYYRATGVLTPWISVGATTGDVVFTVTQSFINPASDINGVLGPVRLMDYKSAQGAQAEFTMLEIAGSKLALAVTGATTAVQPNAVVGGGLSTTSTAATVVGATSIALTATTGLAVGDMIRIDTSTNIEYRVVTSITSLVVGFRDPLLIAHASGVAVVEYSGAGRTVITPSSVRRQPAAAYYDFALVAQSPSDYYELVIFNAISTTESAALTFGNDSIGGIRVTVEGRLNETDLSLPVFQLIVP